MIVENASAEVTAFAKAKSRRAERLRQLQVRNGAIDARGLIFAVQPPQGSLAPPPDEPIKLGGHKMAEGVGDDVLGDASAARQPSGKPLHLRLARLRPLVEAQLRPALRYALRLGSRRRVNRS